MPILICLVLFLLFPRKTLTSFIREITSVFVQPGGKQMAVVVGTLTYYANSHRGLQSLDATWLHVCIHRYNPNIQCVWFQFFTCALESELCQLPQGTPISRCHMAAIHSYQLHRVDLSNLTCSCFHVCFQLPQGTPISRCYMAPNNLYNHMT